MRAFSRSKFIGKDLTTYRIKYESILDIKTIVIQSSSKKEAKEVIKNMNDFVRFIR